MNRAAAKGLIGPSRSPRGAPTAARARGQPAARRRRPGRGGGGSSLIPPRQVEVVAEVSGLKREFRGGVGSRARARGVAAAGASTLGSRDTGGVGVGQVDRLAGEVGLELGRELVGEGAGGGHQRASPSRLPRTLSKGMVSVHE